MLKHSSSEVVLSPPSLQLGPWLTLSMTRGRDYVSDLGLDRDLPQAGVSVPKIEKADYESAWKALGCCSWRGCHPQNCN